MIISITLKLQVNPHAALSKTKTTLYLSHCAESTGLYLSKHRFYYGIPFKSEFANKFNDFVKREN